jgi:archaemetzincin
MHSASGFCSDHQLVRVIIIAAILLTAFLSSSQNYAPEKLQNLIKSLNGSVPMSDSSGGFYKLGSPESDDWLAEHVEPGQTFEQYKLGPRNDVGADRSIIYLQPVWNLEQEKGPPIDYLKEFTEIYFCMPVKINRTLYPAEKECSMRINHYSYNLQANADRILLYLMKRVPAHAYCMLGITMTDLYPDPMWNFVFGYATYKQRVGIFSFARYSPKFYNVSDSANPRLMLLRSCKILAHETGHMFGMAHCTVYRCVMNGCNSLEENDRQPIHLCPVCLRKLQYATSFDTLKRYESLFRFYRAVGFNSESRWVENRLKSIRCNVDESDH